MTETTRPELYIYGVPGKLGGAATKIRHLILLLKDVFQIRVVLTDRSFLRIEEVTRFLKAQNIPYYSPKDVPPSKGGIALVICELLFFTSGLAKSVKSLGFKTVFSNEMMWEFKGEADAVREGLIDKVLFVSDIQAEKFAELYRGIPSAIPGNYVAPEDFEFRERSNPVFTIGRLSRPDLVKFPEDFPVFYEKLGLAEVKYRVMAWDEKLKRKYRWHRFGPEWDLLGPQKEDTEKFLHTLDLFVYPLGHHFKESWGRSTVEAMLTGCIPIVPIGHQFHNLINHGESGFICSSFKDYQNIVQQLYDDYPLRKRLSRQCAEHARNSICNADDHRKIWIEALTVS